MKHNDKELYYNRDTLYTEVWEYTTLKLCRQYGVSLSALENACKILNVPRPSTNYWMKKELGRAPPPPVLPPFDNPPRLPIRLRKIKEDTNPLPDKKPQSKKPETKPKPNKKQAKIEQVVLPVEADSENEPIQKTTKSRKTPFFKWKDIVPQEGVELPQAFEDAVRLIEKETLPEMAITIPQRTEDEHTLIKNTRFALEKKMNNHKVFSSTNTYGRIRFYGKDLFYIDVGKNSVQRALSILQALCDAFEKRGFDIVSEWNENSRDGYNYVVIMGEKIAFSITESSKKVQIEKNEKHTYLDYEHILTGRLTLQNVHPPYKTGGQYRWNDTNYSTLEEKLNDFVAGCIFASAWEKENEAQRKKREEEWKQREAIRKENERLARIEKQRIENFKKATEYWEHYQSMKAFLAMVRKSYRKSANKNNDTARWIQWAREYLTKYKSKCENLVRYEVEEYKEETRSFVQTYNIPQEEPYNYWKKPWYLKR